MVFVLRDLRIFFYDHRPRHNKIQTTWPPFLEKNFWNSFAFSHLWGIWWFVMDTLTKEETYVRRDCRDCDQGQYGFLLLLLLFRWKWRNRLDRMVHQTRTFSQYLHASDMFIIIFPEFNIYSDYLYCFSAFSLIWECVSCHKVGLGQLMDSELYV